MIRAVNMEEVREKLQQLMNEPDFKGSIRRQIVTLRRRQRNQNQVKKNKIENRIFKNLEDHGVLERMIKILINEPDNNEETHPVFNLISTLQEIHPVRSLKSIEDDKISKMQNERLEDTAENKKPEDCHPQSNNYCSSHVNSRYSVAISGESKSNIHGTNNKNSIPFSKEKLQSIADNKTKNLKHKVEDKRKEINILHTFTNICKDTTETENSKMRMKEMKVSNTSGHMDINKFESLDQDDANRASKTLKNNKNVPEDLHQDKKHIMHIKINPAKCHLHFEILHGKSFLEHFLESSSTFTLFLLFQGQRYWTQPVACTPEPVFNSGFLFKINQDVWRENHMTNASKLLNIEDKIHIVLARVSPNLDRILVSSFYFEWRYVLCAEDYQKIFSIKLMGVGAESNVSVGTLVVRLSLIPKLPEQLTETVILKKIQVEKRIQEHQNRIFMMYAKAWWRDYLSIRPANSQQTVKLFHRDENSQNRPLFHFVQVLKVGRALLELPQEAAWFVSLIPYESSSLLGSLPDVEQIWTPHAFLCLKKGGSENHAVLLCSLLLGFGLDAYVCVGTKIDTLAWSWVMTMGVNNQIIFWESTTSMCYNRNIDESIRQCSYTHPYKTVGCIFNHKSFYANIQILILPSTHQSPDYIFHPKCPTFHPFQESDEVRLCNFNIANRKLWKNMSEAAISSVATDLKTPLIPGWTDPFIHSQDLEVELKNRITEYRRDINLTTRYDDELSHIIAAVLAVYETRHKMGLAVKKEQIDTLVNKKNTKGFVFRALPVRIASTNKRRLFGFCLQHPQLRSIITCHESGCKLAVRINTYVYPDNILSIWVIIASKFRAR